MILRAPGLNPARSHTPRLRAGFTLLEILLASLIAVLLLSALYVAMNVTLQQTQSSRDAMESEDLARGVFNKLSLDLSGTLTPLPPKSGGNSAASGGASSSTSSSSTPGSSSTAPTGSSTPSTSTPSTTTPATGTTDSTTPGVTDNATAFTATPAFQGGIYCQDPTVLVLFLGRTPEFFGRYGDVDQQNQVNQQIRSDQRQVIYKFVSGRGLFRAERPWITGTTITMDLDPDAPESVLLADEVTDWLLEFTDGTTWANVWDGTVPGPDGVTPLGPPRAVRVTLTLSTTTGKGDPLTKQVSQIIMIRAAPGTYTPPMIQATPDGASGSSTGSSSTPSTGSSTPSTGGATGGASGGATGGATGGKTGGASMPSGISLPSGGGGGGAMPAMPSGGAGGGAGGGKGGGKGGG